MSIPLKPFQNILWMTGVVCPLPPYELRAIWALARFGTIAQAAEEIGCTRTTVNNSLLESRQKLGIHSSVTLVAYAMERGWLPPITVEVVPANAPEDGKRRQHAVGRISRDDYYMGITRSVSRGATCRRRSVGAVLVDPHNRVVGTGFNGAPPGQPHCTEVGCKDVDGHCVRALHAEENALLFAGDRAGLRGATAYVFNGTPCYRCARAFLSVGVRRVVCEGSYPDADAISLLEEAGVAVVRYSSPMR